LLRSKRAIVTAVLGTWNATCAHTHTHTHTHLHITSLFQKNKKNKLSNTHPGKSTSIQPFHASFIQKCLFQHVVKRSICGVVRGLECAQTGSALLGPVHLQTQLGQVERTGEEGRQPSSQGGTSHRRRRRRRRRRRNVRGTC
jgi:hypothetical protein